MIIKLNKKELQGKMAELGFNGAEKISVLKQLKKLDDDLKLALIQYVNFGFRTVGIELEDGLNIEKLTTTFNYNYISALLFVQLYRKDPVAAVRTLKAVPDSSPALSAEKFAEISKRLGITNSDINKYNQKYSAPDNNDDISVDTEKK